MRFLPVDSYAIVNGTGVQWYGMVAQVGQLEDESRSVARPALPVLGASTSSRNPFSPVFILCHE